MKQVRNANGKFVCMADAETRTVEIERKGFKTVVRFTANGRVEIINTKPIN